MPARPLPAPLPENPSLEFLRNRAKALQRRAAAGDPGALDLFAELHPRPTAGPPFRLADAQLVLARSYDFPSWPQLVAHVRTVEGYRWSAPVAPVDDGDPVAAFLRLGTLTYTDDRPAAWTRARRLLRERPEVVRRSLHAAAAAGDVDAVAAHLRSDPATPDVRGGPHGWTPLQYLAFSRVPAAGAEADASVACARMLIQAGADVEAGFLWHGLPSPFTVLTGALGGGEQDQPPHPAAMALAGVLLEAGADPNDNQGLYNRMFSPADDHLELLFAFGLGGGDGGIWHRRLGGRIPTPRAMLEEQLRWAAAHDLPHRVRLLLDHGVDPDGLGYHPIFGDRTAHELAVQAGNRTVAELLARAGARVTTRDAVDQLHDAVLAGDAGDTAQRTAADPFLAAALRRRHPDLVVQAARTGRPAAVRLALDLGADVDLPAADGHRETGLHAAAERGSAEMTRVLLAGEASTTVRDGTYDGTPADWALHCGHPELVAMLRGDGSEYPGAAAEVGA